MSRLAFELLLGQVLEALPPAPAGVVDAGGGTGQLAVALAGHGYRVTVVDTSAAMLATCAQRAADAGPEVAGRVTGVQGDAADLDLILYDGPPVDSPELTVPHPRARERAFVLVPLCDADPFARFPDGELAAAALARLGPVTGVVPVGELEA